MKRVNAKFMAADVAECAVFVALMVAATFIQIPFPLVPLTFQTVISVLAGLLCGAKKGAISMSVYCFMGLVGIPVFSAGGGFAYVLKPSFGYVIGFIPAATVAGLIASRKGLPFWRYVVAALAAFIVDYLVGIPYCIIAARLAGVENLAKLLVAGNLIYMPKDAALCVLAAALARCVLPVVDKGRIKLGGKNICK